MNARHDFSPIRYPDVIAPQTMIPAPAPSMALLYQAADDMADWAQSHAVTFRPAKPADPDDYFSQDEDADEAEEVRELLAHAPAPTPNGKWVGLATDACAALIELQKLIGELDFFSAGDTGLGRLQQASERANVILQRAGYRNGNAAL